jgi:hypothetical protein
VTIILLLVVLPAAPSAVAQSGGEYTLVGGFWSGAAPPPYEVFLPLILRNY